MYARLRASFLAAFTTLALSTLAVPYALALSEDELADLVLPPYALGAPINDDGVYHLLNSGGERMGYVFETEPLAPLPGFSGSPINIVVTLDKNGRFLDVRLLAHNEPIFVSGLGEQAFNDFFAQYRGLSIASSLVVGTARGETGKSGALVYLDGVSKATASIRIAHESVLAATLSVAREKMRGISSTMRSAHPDPDHDEHLRWTDLVAQGLATHFIVTNREVQDIFAGTIWQDDDPEARDDPAGHYLDLWIVDIGPRAIARAALSADSFLELQDFLTISPHDEPILLIESGRHGLVSGGFVRNTTPAWLSMHQDDLPIAVRDADLFVELGQDAPQGVAMILRADRRLGFDPSLEWTQNVLAIRRHGSFQPDIGTATLSVAYQTNARFFRRDENVQSPAPAWLGALRDRAGHLILLAAFLIGLIVILSAGMKHFTALAAFPAIRLAILALMTILIGWWGQGQLSILTPLGLVRALLDQRSLSFLLYDPFSLVIWGVTLIGAIVWGRGLFCGWMCPFGALQEFCHWIGHSLLRLPQLMPGHQMDRLLKRLKYVLLAGLVAVVVFAPAHIDTAVEIEPFKTAISVFFLREWYYVLYALFWLTASLFLFRGFCRYVCPLGAFVAIVGCLRRWNWIDRRVECGNPCQLCKKRCKYDAIEKNGDIVYSECFQCLDCVRIHDDPKQCVPLVLAAKGRPFLAEAGDAR